MQKFHVDGIESTNLWFPRFLLLSTIVCVRVMVKSFANWSPPFAFGIRLLNAGHIFGSRHFECKAFIDRIQANQMETALKRLVNAKNCMRTFLSLGAFVFFLSMNYANQNQRMKMLQLCKGSLGLAFFLVFTFFFFFFAFHTSRVFQSGSWFGNKMDAVFIALGKYYVIYMTHRAHKNWLNNR